MLVLGQPEGHQQEGHFRALHVAALDFPTRASSCSKNEKRSKGHDTVEVLY